jgi:hypothetical protein
MNFRILLLIFLFPLLLMSCKKEAFPDNDDLKGCWEQITSDYFLDREGLCFDGQETLYYTRVASRAIWIDTLIYILDKKDERLYLKPYNCPMCPMSPYKIQLNTEKNVLYIWDLHSSDSGEEKFKKQ